MSERDRVSVLVCRGCCCGTEGKHPELAHDEQLNRLRAALPTDDSRLWTVDCLGPCERSNVVVVRTSAGRRWFGEVLDPADTEALAGWIAGGAPAEPPPLRSAASFDPTTGPTFVAEPRRLGPDALADLVHDTAVAGQGAWSVGVHGAVAEVGLDGTGVSRQGRAVVIEVPGGRLRLAPSDEVTAYVITDRPGSPLVTAVVLAVPRPDAATGLRIHDGDPDAVRSEDRGDALVDLGLGRAARFCVRTADLDLLGRLAALQGAGWREVLDQAGELLVEHSPVRVVSTPLGRAEVDRPMPRTGEPSAPGPRTHLLPGELELDRDLPVGVELPAGLVPAATFHPPPGWAFPIEEPLDPKVRSALRR